MKAIFTILLWLVGVAIILLSTGFFLPETSHVERTAVIHAKPETVYNLLYNLTTYDNWMTWNKMDPNWKVQYAAQNTGKGAWYKWQSQNRNVGNGKLTINESIVNEQVTTKMEFEGIKEPSLAGWQLKPPGNDTELKWYMNSRMDNNPFYRWMGVFMNKMAGPMFDNGLNNISKLADKAELTLNAIQEPHYTIEETVVTKKIVVFVADSANSTEEISKKFMQIIPVELGGFLKKHHLQMAGVPMAWYNTQSMPLVFDIAAPVNKAPDTTEGRIKVREVAAGKVVVAHFYGPYDLTIKAYETVTEWMKQHNKIANGAPYEVYLGDPGVEKDPYKILTDIVFPVK